MNRGQNASIVSECRPPGWRCVEVRICDTSHFHFYEKCTFQTYRETLPASAGWSSLYAGAVHNGAADEFVVRAMLRDGEDGFFQQVALVTRRDLGSGQGGGGRPGGSTVSFPLIQDHTEVDQVVAWDHRLGIV